MYWKLDLSELPSRGMLYSPNTEIRIRPMTVGDMKFLATINESNCTPIINELLYNVLKLTNIKFDDILLCDRMFFCFWLRANSLITHNGYTFKITCEHCKKNYEHEVTLNDFETRFINHLPETISLPGYNVDVKLKLPSIKDLDFKYPLNTELEKIGRCIDMMPNIKLKKEFLKNLEAMDYAILFGKTKNLDTAFEDLFTFTCPFCHQNQDFSVRISDAGMFNGINLYDILKRVVSITKYTSMQISDETPWMEMELYVDIINKMIEEENEANAKQQSMANSKLATAKANSHISKPSIQKPNIHR